MGRAHWSQEQNQREHALQRVSELVLQKPGLQPRTDVSIPGSLSLGPRVARGFLGPQGLLGLGHPLCLSPLQAPSVGPGPSPNKAHAGSRLPPQPFVRERPAGLGCLFVPHRPGQLDLSAGILGPISDSSCHFPGFTLYFGVPCIPHVKEATLAPLHLDSQEQHNS